jgi:hypothetical protein
MTIILMTLMARWECANDTVKSIYTIFTLVLGLFYDVAIIGAIRGWGK